MSNSPDTFLSISAEDLHWLFLFCPFFLLLVSNTKLLSQLRSLSAMIYLIHNLPLFLCAPISIFLALILPLLLQCIIYLSFYTPHYPHLSLPHCSASLVAPTPLTTMFSWCLLLPFIFFPVLPTLSTLPLFDKNG